jgi:hypothetical protein
MIVSADDEKERVLEGTELLAVGVSDIRELTEGKLYKALYGWEKGIYKDRPYVSIIGDNGKQYSCHLSRFRIPQPKLTFGTPEEILNNQRN